MGGECSTNEKSPLERDEGRWEGDTRVLNNLACMSWTFLTQNRVQWQVVLNMAMKFRFAQKQGFAN
jgi:hypothetical protein